jgi:O-antigen ligase
MVEEDMIEDKKKAYALMALLAATLVLPGGYTYLAVALALAGLWAGTPTRQVLVEAWAHGAARWLVGGAFAYVATHAGLGFLYGYPIKYYEPILPYLFVPAMLAGVWRWRPMPRYMWLGLALGAMLAGGVSWFQVYVLGVPRAYGAHGNPIPFGHIALMLAGASMCGYLYFTRRREGLALRLACLAGVAAGLVASFLSGSKGGWFAIFLIFFIWGWRATAARPPVVRLATMVAVCVAFPLLLWLAPQELVWDRLVGGLDGALHWFLAGDVTEGSVSIRFEIWRFGLRQFMERPLFGWPQDEAVAAMREHLRQFDVQAVLPPNFRTFDNLLVETLIGGGLFGLAGLVCLFVGVLAAFLSLYLRGTAEVRELSLAGVLMAVFVLGYGLSVNALGVNAFRQVFVAWSVLWLGMCLWPPARPQAAGGGASPR